MDPALGHGDAMHRAVELAVAAAIKAKAGAIAFVWFAFERSAG
jgi:hypothetical protein